MERAMATKALSLPADGGDLVQVVDGGQHRGAGEQQAP
jgi:hypothetical protein